MERKNIADRFWEKVTVGNSNDCWEWQAYLTPKNYGVIRDWHNTELAHRVSWRLLRGEIPAGLCVLHRCDNPRCVNPNHLFLGTISDNNKDRAAKGRGSTGPQDGENNPHAKLNGNKVLKLRRMYSSGKYLQRELAKLFSITQPTVSRIVKGAGWTKV